MADSPSLAAISLAQLRAELSKRQDDDPKPECGSGAAIKGYNTSLHVGALVLILLLSTLACSFPIIVRRFPRFPVPHRILFLSRHFGTGVLVATAFVHLLPTAFVSLTDPCLPSFWNEGYPAMAGFIAMLSVLVVVGIEMFFASKGAGHVHAADYQMIDVETDHLLTGHDAVNGQPLPRGDSSLGNFHQDNPHHPIRHRSSGSSASLDSRQAPYSRENDSDIRGESETSHFGSPHDHMSEDDRENLDDMDPLTSAHAFGSKHRGPSGHMPRGAAWATSNGQASQSHAKPQSGVQDGSLFNSQQQDSDRLLLQCLLLEAGILFHSIFIGMALSVATGTPFVVLLIAISFHQTFEGLALGSRIATIPSFEPGSLKPWFMALAYGTTTPAGQAIGLVVHRLYDPQSQAGLLTTGIMNSISSGLLLFAGLVQLLAEDFLAEKSYETLFGRKRMEACGAVIGGALLMAAVGAFA